MSGPAMAVAIGYALKCPPLVLFSLIAVGSAANGLGGAGGPLAVLVIAIVAAEFGKAVSKETKIDILVTPAGHHLRGCGSVRLVGSRHRHRRQLRWGSSSCGPPNCSPSWMGILVSVLVGVALTLPISSAAICAALGLTGLAGGAAVAGCCAQMVGFAVMSFRENQLGRPRQPGPGHLHAPDGQYRPESPDLAARHSGLAPSPAPWPPVCSTWR